MGSYQNPIITDLDLTPVKFSLLSSTLFLAIYGIMQIPVGIIVDHIGLKKSLFLASITCGLSCMIFSYSGNYQMAVISRIIMGFGSSFGFICLLIAVYEWMPQKHNGFFIGFSQFIGTLGPMLSAGPIENLSHSNNIDWRNIFFICSISGFLISILVILFVENKRKKSLKQIILTRPENTSSSLRKLFSRSQPWYIALLASCLYFSVEYLSENEGRNFLIEKNIGNLEAAYIITISWLGYAFGAPLLGFISDYIERRKIILIISAYISLISILVIFFSSQIIHVFIAFFFLGISASGQSIAFANIAEQFKNKFTAIGFGLCNFMIMTIAAINAPILAYVTDIGARNTDMISNKYDYIFLFLIFVSILAIILSSLFVKETFCKSAVESTIINK